MQKRVDWIQILVMCVVLLFCISLLLYTVADRRREDNEYFKGRLASLETRMNQQDKRLDAYELSIKKMNEDIKEISTLTVQVNANVLENSKRLEEILNPPKPPVKKGKPKSHFKPEKLYTPPIQGPRPVPPQHNKTGIPHIEGKLSE